MHEYYRSNILKVKKENEGYLRFVKAELEQNAGKPYSEEMCIRDRSMSVFTYRSRLPDFR